MDHISGVSWLALSYWMMTSSNGNIFHVTGPWCGEFTGPGWIPLTKASDAEIWYLIYAWINGWVINREAGDLRRNRAHYDLTVMVWSIFSSSLLIEENGAWNLRILELQMNYYDCFTDRAMMTSSNGNIFRVTGHLCGEFTGPRWIPRTKASDAELWCFLWSAYEWMVE